MCRMRLSSLKSKSPSPATSFPAAAPLCSQYANPAVIRRSHLHYPPYRTRNKCSYSCPCTVPRSSCQSSCQSRTPSVYYQGETELAKLLAQQPNIIIMTYDTFVGAIAKHDLRGINIRRVVIDEAHTIPTDASCRTVMEVVAPLVVKLGCLFLLLTGTMPVYFESSLLCQFYPSPVALVRMNTARLNLRYSINLYEEGSVSMAALVAAIGEELKSSIPSHESKCPESRWLKGTAGDYLSLTWRISRYHGRMQPAESDPELGDWLARTTASPVSFVSYLC